MTKQSAFERIYERVWGSKAGMTFLSVCRVCHWPRVYCRYLQVHQLVLLKICDIESDQGVTSAISCMHSTHPDVLRVHP